MEIDGTKTNTVILKVKWSRLQRAKMINNFLFSREIVQFWDKILQLARAAHTGFLALPLGELAFAKQMTERANSASSHQSYSGSSLSAGYSLSLAARRQSSSLTREPALSVAARHLSQRERRVWFVRQTQKNPEPVVPVLDFSYLSL